MKSTTYRFAVPPHSAAPAIQSVILYEDLVSGINGKVFCELLAEEIARGCTSSSSLWRVNILDHASIAAKAAFQAASSDFIVVSLSGDEDLTPAARRWLEAQVQAATHGSRFLVLLTNASAIFPEIAERTREWLCRLCVSSAVEFFSYHGELSEGEIGVCFIAQEQNGPRVLRETEESSLQLAVS